MPKKDFILSNLLEPQSKFRNQRNGRYLKGLFFETTNIDKSSCLYSLKDWDHEVEGIVYPSLYRLYMETNDPTEWKFATSYLDGWEHWEMLCNCTWFKPFIERWRREVELRFKSAALSRIMAEGKASSRDSFQANKYLLEKGWEPKTAGKRGRPSKDEIASEARNIIEQRSRIDEDFERLTGKG